MRNEFGFRKKTFFTFLVLFFSLCSPATFASRTEVYLGEAKHGDQLAYTEKHTVIFDDAGNIQEAETDYFDTKGEKISILKSDFRSSLTSPDHVMTDLRTGNVQGVRSTADKFILFNKDSGKTETTKELAKNFGGERIAFGCQGLNYYLVKNMDSFQKKKQIPVKFLFPGKLDAYNFEVSFVKELENGIVEVQIEIDSWFLSLFAPKLHAKYDKNKQRLVWYQGLSNLKDDKGKNQDVTITYKYDLEQVKE